MDINLFSQINQGATRKKTFTATSSVMELPENSQCNQNLQLYNAGSVALYFSLLKNNSGSATIPTETTDGSDCVPPGAVYGISRGNKDTHIAAITESDTAELVVTAYYGF